MKTKQGKPIEKELGLVGHCYYNNFGVEAYLLKNGKVFMQAMKLGKKIPDHYVEISLEYFTERFRDENKSDITLILDALRFLDPYYEEQE